MLLKKGTLVVRNEIVQDKLYPFFKEFTLGVATTDPYATIFTTNSADGKALFSQEKIVIDVLSETVYIKKVPIEFVNKYTSK